MMLARNAIDCFAVADRHGEPPFQVQWPGRSRFRVATEPVMSEYDAFCDDMRRALRIRNRSWRSRDGRGWLGAGSGRASTRRRMPSGAGSAAGDILWRSGTIGIVGAGFKARGVRTTGGGNTNQRENNDARPSTRARLHLGARHVVTHSYA